MAYCTRCGAVTQNQFCGACGWPVEFPPVPPCPQMPQQVAAPARKRRLWPWVTGIVFVVWIGGGWFFYQDNERRFAEPRNGVDILSTDEKTGVVTARDEKTGKIVKMDFNDIEPDQIRLPLSGMPRWVPAYPGVTESSPPKNGSGVWLTSASVADAAGFYQEYFSQTGMPVTKKTSQSGGALETVTLNAKDTAGDRVATVVVRRAGAGSSIAISASGK